MGFEAVALIAVPSAHTCRSRMAAPTSRPSFRVSPAHARISWGRCPAGPVGPECRMAAASSAEAIARISGWRVPPRPLPEPSTLAHCFDDRWDIGVGVAQKFLVSRPRRGGPSSGRRWSSRQFSSDGQEEPVVDVFGIEQRCPIQHPQPHGSVDSSAPGTRIDFAIGLAPVHRLEPLRSGR